MPEDYSEISFATPRVACVPVHNLFCCKVISSVDFCPRSYGGTVPPRVLLGLSSYALLEHPHVPGSGTGPEPATRSPPSCAPLVLCLH